MSFRVENHFEDYIKKLIRATSAAADEIKVTELAEMQSNTPVKTRSKSVV